MPRHYQSVLIMWGERFDETAAATFVTALREVGLRVKLVGLTPPPIGGAYGLALVPDVMLDEALQYASDALAVIIPCTAQVLRPLENDPRLQEFFCQASGSQARFFIAGWEEPDTHRLSLFQCTSNITPYPQDALREFADNLAFVLMGHAFEV